jgi:hypothetical protein
VSNRLITVIALTALLLTAFSFNVTMTTSALFEQIENPFDVKAAPLFSTVVYLTEEPAYSTPCDERGDFKTSIGTPTVTISDSKLLFETDTSLVSRIVLSKTDVPEMNQSSTTFIQMSVAVADVVSGVANISIYDTVHQAGINVSIFGGGTIDYWYSTTTPNTWATNVLYTPVVDGAYYTFAFDISATTATWYLYSSTGTLLADMIVNDNNLTTGDVNEIRFEMATAANSMSIDYLYILGSPTHSTEESGLAMEALVPDAEVTENRCDFDPTAFELDSSLRADAFNLTDPDLQAGDATTLGEFINDMGLRPEKLQRVSGQGYAEGWTNFRLSVETQLKTYIADIESCDVNDVFLVDYYINYIQFKTTINPAVAALTAEVFDAALEPIIEAMGGHYGSSARTSTGSRTSVIDPVLETPIVMPIDPVASLISEDDTIYMARDGLLGGAMDLVFGKQVDYAAMVTRDAAKYARDSKQAVNDAVNATGKFAAEKYNELLNLSEKAYNQLNDQLINFMAWSKGNVESIIASYEAMSERVQAGFNKYYAFAEQQFSATNAIIAKLLLQNADWANQSKQMSAYFAGETAKANDVIMNLTSALTSALSGDKFWNGVTNQGKASSDPLTLTGFFGNKVTEYKNWIIGFAIVAIVSVAALMIFRSSRKTDRKEKS